MTFTDVNNPPNKSTHNLSWPQRIHVIFQYIVTNHVLKIFKIINMIILFYFSVNVSQSTLVRPVARLVTLAGNCTALSMESSLMAICHPIKSWEVGVTLKLTSIPINHK